MGVWQSEKNDHNGSVSPVKHKVNPAACVATDAAVYLPACPWFSEPRRNEDNFVDQET